MTLQSLVKHFLTEGDKFILSWFSPLQDQGGYAIAVNYGMAIVVKLQTLYDGYSHRFSCRADCIPADRRKSTPLLLEDSHIYHRWWQRQAVRSCAIRVSTEQPRPNTGNSFPLPPRIRSSLSPNTTPTSPAPAIPTDECAKSTPSLGVLHPRARHQWRP